MNLMHRRPLISAVLLAMTACAFCTGVLPACASSTTSASSGSPGEDAAIVELPDGAPGPDGGTTDGGADGFTAAADFVLTVDGNDIPIDQSTRTFETHDVAGVRTTTLSARIIDGEKYAWNKDKAPLSVQLSSTQPSSVPVPLGDIRCVRKSTEPYEYAIVSINNQGGPLYKSTDASCVATIETWTEGVSYKGTAKGLLLGDSTLPFTFAWNVSKK